MLEPAETMNGSHAKDPHGVWHIVDRSNVPFCIIAPSSVRPRTPLQIIEQRQLGDETPAGEAICQPCRRNRQILSQTGEHEV